MSLFGALKGFAKAATSVTKIPILGKALTAIPFVGTGLTAVSIGMDVMGGFGGSKGGGAAGLPAPSGALPPLSGGMGMLMPSGGGGGGAGFPAMAMPSGGGLKTVHTSPVVPTDMATLQAWQQAGLIIPYGALGVAHRARKGYRVVHVNGMTIGMRTDVARRLHLVAAHHKPPISVGEWHALKKSHSVIKKMAKVNKMVHSIQRHGGHKAAPAVHHKKRK